jgi:uncharacterized protein DUF4129
LKPRRFLPYLIALVLLAWVLGSLARSEVGGGSILSNSIWLIYLIELAPLVAVGLMIALVVSLIRNWKELAESIGFGLAPKRGRKKKKSGRVEIIVWMAAWLVAIVVLLSRCGRITCSANGATDAVKHFVIGNDPLPGLPTLFSPAIAFGRSIDYNILVPAFLALLVVSSVIMVRAIKVSWDETRGMMNDNLQLVQHQGQVAVQDAIRVLESGEGGDHRTRIILCYERMIRAAAKLGAPVGLDRTARELEKGIRGMFQLKGQGIARLTSLFEEARYSLHVITDQDSQSALDSLLEIQEELRKTPLQEA